MDPDQRHSTRACLECNRKKTKCDMVRPTCGLCHRTCITCTFPSKRKAPCRPANAKPRSKDVSRQVKVNLERLMHLLESNADVHGISQEADSIDGTVASTTIPNIEAGGVESAYQLQPQPKETTNAINAEFDQSLQSPSALFSWMSFSPSEQAFAVAAARPDAGISTQESSQSSTTNIQLTYPQALHLVDVFFQKVQPWLPLLHKARFLAYCSERLTPGQDPLKDLQADETLLMYSLFALSARFSEMPAFSNMISAERGVDFGNKARLIYEKARLAAPSLRLLQGCILLAFYLYTSELSSQAWILVGVCVRMAYDMGLSEIDDDDSSMTADLTWSQAEEMRRAWWLVWELDTFGSIVYKKPFGVDRHRMSVWLPVSDEAWFSNKETRSARLLTLPNQCWKSLADSPNQCARAWFLVANHLMSLALDLLQRKHGHTLDERQAMECDIACLKLALPSCFDISHEYLGFNDNSFAKHNWIIGTQLVIMATSFVTYIVCSQHQIDMNILHDENIPELAQQMRTFELSRIVCRWSPEHIALAHPFLCCMLLPVHVSRALGNSHQSVASSTHALIDLVLRRVGEKWALGSLLRKLLVAQALEDTSEMSTEDLSIAKRFAIFFPPSLRNAKSISPQSIQGDLSESEASNMQEIEITSRC